MNSQRWPFASSIEERFGRELSEVDLVRGKKIMTLVVKIHRFKSHLGHLSGPGHLLSGFGFLFLIAMMVIRSKCDVNN